jgi:hypothetical protein
MKGKRTGIEFEKHELIITKSSDAEIIIHDLKKPDTVCGRIKFINAFGILIVLGDYGHWMFNRSFIPYPGEYVSDGYWNEKCEMEAQEYDSEETKKELENGIKSGLEEIGYTGDKLAAAKEFYEKCLFYVDCSEWEYTAFAHGEYKPGFIDHEDVPHCKKTKQWLRIVFDGFDEICRRLKEQEQQV